MSDTTQDCLKITIKSPKDIRKKDKCILEHGTGADCHLIQGKKIREACHKKHACKVK